MFILPFCASAWEQISGSAEGPRVDLTLSLETYIKMTLKLIHRLKKIFLKKRPPAWSALRVISSFLAAWLLYAEMAINNVKLVFLVSLSLRNELHPEAHLFLRCIHYSSRNVCFTSLLHACGKTRLWGAYRGEWGHGGGGCFSTISEHTWTQTQVPCLTHMANPAQCDDVIPGSAAENK